MQKITNDHACLEKFRPVFKQSLYKTSVDVVGKHISGLLVFKEMPDSSLRIVFTNEMGFSFFDFGFFPGDSFRVFQITPQMDKKALIKTLRKDFDLILFRQRHEQGSFSLSDSSGIYHGYPQSEGVNYYVTDTACEKLIKMQRASDKKPVMEAFMEENSGDPSPDSISIRHLNFNFSISLKKISGLAAP